MRAGQPGLTAGQQWRSGRGLAPDQHQCRAARGTGPPVGAQSPGPSQAAAGKSAKAGHSGAPLRERPSPVPTLSSGRPLPSPTRSPGREQTGVFPGPACRGLHTQADLEGPWDSGAPECSGGHGREGPGGALLAGCPGSERLPRLRVHWRRPDTAEGGEEQPEADLCTRPVGPGGWVLPPGAPFQSARRASGLTSTGRETTTWKKRGLSCAGTKDRPVLPFPLAVLQGGREAQWAFRPSGSPHPPAWGPNPLPLPGPESGSVLVQGWPPCVLEHRGTRARLSWEGTRRDRGGWTALVGDTR